MLLFASFCFSQHTDTLDCQQQVMSSFRHCFSLFSEDEERPELVLSIGSCSDDTNRS